MKVIAFHLPQYHTFPENDEWWGKGFTEWTNVKSGKKYYDGQYQPRVPLGKNYYNLLDVDALKWQSEIAGKYGVYGFCFYHYWFNGHMLMQKPVEIYRQLPSTEKIHYCICWANENWTRAWADKTNEILIQQKYGDEKEWKAHFDYLLPFFKDEMYIKENGKPMVVIYRPELVYNLSAMIDCWQKLAEENGFPGLSLSYQQYSYLEHHGAEEKKFDHNIEYQPAYTLAQMNMQSMNIKEKIYHFAPDIFRKLYTRIKMNQKKENESMKKNMLPPIYDYDDIWKKILQAKPSTTKSIPGAFVDFDNSPRRKERGAFFRGVTVEKFRDYFSAQIKHAVNEYHSDFIFLFAWNEWGESAYLEPDEERKYGFLEAVRDALNENKELE